MKQFQNSFTYIFSQQFLCLNPELKHLRSKVHQTIPSRRYTYKNFFETILLPTIGDQSELLNLSIMELFKFEYQSSNLTHLLTYLNHRYPQIKIPQQQKDFRIKTKLTYQKDNSKTNLHNILNLFDPNPRTTAAQPPNLPSIPPSTTETSTTKSHMTFKRLTTKLTTLAAFSRMQCGKQQSLLIGTNAA
jgi:hypothetical protein